MAVPKKRTGKAAQGHRRSNWKATKPEVTKCTNCGAIALTHTVCTACGYYKGKAVSIKSADFTEAAEAKKPAKKTAEKTKKAETKVEEVKSETVVEETKAKEVKTEKAKPKAKSTEKTTEKKTEKAKTEKKAKKTEE